MASNLITLERAKKEIERLQEYVNLVEGYPTDTVEQWIIKEYGITNSFIQVTKKAYAAGLTVNGISVDKQYVASVIDGQPKDDLHRILRTGYRGKVRASKKGRDF